MKLCDNWLLVEEIQLDYTIDGLLQKYDDTDPIMIVKVLDCDTDTESNLLTYTNDLSNTYLLCNRLNKTPWHGKYLIKKDNIIAILTEQDINTL